MKKYVRTKDGVYELISNLDNKHRMNVKAKTYFSYVLIAKSSIVAQANDLRELCDCYAYGTETTRDYNVARGWNINDRKIYGCILTEKGIINVAKFDSDGELVLL